MAQNPSIKMATDSIKPRANSNHKYHYYKNKKRNSDNKDKKRNSDNKDKKRNSDNKDKKRNSGNVSKEDTGRGIIPLSCKGHSNSKSHLKKDNSETSNQISQRKKLAAKKRSEQSLNWTKRCTKHSQLMKDFPNASYSIIDKSTYDAVYTKDIKRLGFGPRYFHLTADNFSEPLTTLLRAEEAWQHVEMRNYDMRNVTLKRVVGDAKSAVLYQITLRDTIDRASSLPKVVPSDSIVLRNGLDIHMMLIADIQDDLINLRGMDSNFSLPVEGKKYDVSFIPSGVTFGHCIKAVREISNDPKLSTILSHLSPLISYQEATKIDCVSSSTKELSNRLKRFNARQAEAITQILEARCRPQPYILFGPPGTGKTSTLVEAVVQMHKRSKKIKILVCANSNTCVDALATLILASGEIESLVRLSSKFYYSQSKRPDYFKLVSKGLGQYRIVVTTNIMASKLPPNYYDYVLIDEAGHCHIPETLIPITKLKSNGCVVLAGDPMQLGPVIKSFEVSRLGLGTSLLERLCRLKIYERDTEGNYNGRYITKLVESYRCDPRILGLCNDLFYHGDLSCLNTTPSSILNILDLKKPLVFARVNGFEATQNKSFSRYNRIEAQACAEYLIKLYMIGIQPDQVGLITPYLLQKTIIQEELSKQIKAHRAVLDNRFKLSKNNSKKSTSATNQQKTGAPSLLVSTETYSCRTNVGNLSDRDPGKMSNVDTLVTTLQKMKLQAREVQAQRKAKEKAAVLKQVPKMDWQCKIDTVDAFQGDEREIILVSTVRSPFAGAIDQCSFLADAKRFNVTISRAKWLAVVFGHPAVLKCSDLWTKYGKSAIQLKYKI